MSRMHTPVDIKSFVVALILAPVIVALPGLTGTVLGLIFSYGTLIGLPAYVLIGGPCFWMAIRGADTRREKVPLWRFLTAALAANAIAFPLGVLVLAVLEADSYGAFRFMLFYSGFGLIGSSLHGLAFGLIYRASAPPVDAAVEADPRVFD